MSCPVPESSLDSLYLGNPPNMIALPIPDAGLAQSVSRGEQLRQRSDNGTTLVRRPRIKRQWTGNYSQRQLSDLDTLLGAWSGVIGRGPYRLVDPNWRNALDVDQSTILGVVGANTTWLDQTGALLAADASTPPPPDAPSSGVLNFGAAAVAGFAFGSGSVVGGVATVDTTRAVPFIPGADITASVYAYLPVGTSACTLRLIAAGHAVADGTFSGAYAQHSDLVLATGWQRISVLVPAGLWLASQVGWVSLIPTIQAGPSGPRGVRLAAPMISYSSTLDPWVIGLSCPRVHAGGAALGLNSTEWQYQSVGSLVFAEA